MIAFIINLSKAIIEAEVQVIEKEKVIGIQEDQIHIGIGEEVGVLLIKNIENTEVEISEILIIIKR